MFRKCLLFFFLSLRCFANAFDDIDGVVNEMLQEFHVPGMAIGVIQDHNVIYAKGFGLRNLEKNLPVTEKTLFHVGSCTKAFTSFLIAQLAEEGLCSWDDPVLKHIPEFQLFDPELTKEVTLRDLSAHRTGILRHDAIWFCSDTLSRNDILTTLPYLEPICALREKFYYNNFMYGVLGLVIERITGETWEEALSHRILNPLKMSDSNVSIDELLQKENISMPYAEIDGIIETFPHHYSHAVAPGGALNSNVKEMLKWVDLQLFPSKIVKRETLEEMHTIQMPFFENDVQEIGIENLGYGLGWMIGDYKGHKIIHHAGAVDGFISSVLFSKEANWGIVILSNSSSDGYLVVSTIGNILLDRLFEEPETDWLSCARHVYPILKEALRDEEFEETTPSRPLSEYIGQYTHPAYREVSIIEEGGHLVALYGNHRIPLLHTEGDSFGGQIRSLLLFGVKWVPDFIFYTNDSGTLSEVQIAFEPLAKPISFKRKKD